MKKKNIFLFLIFLIVSISAFFFWFNAERKAKLGLEGFYELTLKDPLFYSPFFDTEEFEKAIQELKEEESELKKVATANLEKGGICPENSIAILKKQDLFPYDFLEVLI